MYPRVYFSFIDGGGGSWRLAYSLRRHIALIGAHDLRRAEKRHRNGKTAERQAL